MFLYLTFIPLKSVYKIPAFFIICYHILHLYFNKSMNIKILQIQKNHTFILDVIVWLMVPMRDASCLFVCQVSCPFFFQ